MTSATWYQRLFAAVFVIAGLLFLAGCELNSPYLDEIDRKIASDLTPPIPPGDGPTVEIMTATNPVAAAPIPLEIKFSRAVVGFEQSDVQVGNATVTAFATADDTVFDVTLDSPAADPTTITISVAEGAALDTVGRPSQAASLELGYDTSVLTTTVTTPLSSPTNVNPIPFTIEFSQETDGLGIADLSLTNGTASNLQTADQITFTLDVTPLGQGDVQLVVPAGATSSVATGRGNLEASFTRRYDSEAPTAPSVSGTSPTSSLRPTWSWTPGDGGNGSYRFKLDNSNLASGATPTTGTSHTPTSDLSVDSHTLYVQERDAAGNWSDSGEHTIVIDTAQPAAPSVSGTALTQNRTPAWTWTSAASSNASGSFRYRHDSEAWSSETPNTTWTLDPAVAAGVEVDVVFYVQEKSTAGVWSLSGTFTTTVDNLPPPAPTMGATGTTSSPTQDSTPTWVWSSPAGGGGNGTYEYKLTQGATQITSGSTTSTSWSVSSSSPLGEGTYRLSVRERDAVGNWGPYGTDDIEVDFLPAGTLTIRDDSDNSSTSTDDWQVKLVSAVTNATEMRFKNATDTSFSAWESFATNKTWTLSGGDGNRTVYAEYSDTQGTVIATSDSITCNPAWENVGYGSLTQWPMGSSTLTNYLNAGQGFVVRFRTNSVAMNSTYTKVVVNSRSSDVISVSATTYGYSIPLPVEITIAVDDDWDCNPRRYIDLNDGTTSTTQQSGSDISIYHYYTTVFPPGYRQVIELVNPDWGGAFDLWTPQ